MSLFVSINNALVWLIIILMYSNKNNLGAKGRIIDDLLGSNNYFMSLDRPNISDSMMVTMENMPPTRYLIDSTFWDSIWVRS